MTSEIPSEKPDFSITESPPVVYSFVVYFFREGSNQHNAVDIRFRKVSGISAKIGIDIIDEGGENLFSHRLPGKVSYGNLLLERGLVIDSELNKKFYNALGNFELEPGNTLIALLDEVGDPISAWLFLKTYPVSWNISDLDADVNDIVISKMELSFERFITLKD